MVSPNVDSYKERCYGAPYNGAIVGGARVFSVPHPTAVELDAVLVGGIVGIDHLAVPVIYENADQTGYTYGQTFLAQGSTVAGLRAYIGDPTRSTNTSVNEIVGPVQLILYQVGTDGAATEVASQTLGSAGSTYTGLVDFQFTAPVPVSVGLKYFLALRTADPFGLGLRAATSSTYAGGAEAWIVPGTSVVVEYSNGRDLSFGVLTSRN